MTLKVRAAEADDYQAIADIYNSGDVTEKVGMLPYNSTHFWKKMLENMNDPTRHKLVCQLDDRVVGVLDLSALWGEHRHIGLIGIAVHHDYQRKGVGQALLLAALDLADNWLGFAKLELYPYEDNKAAIALYQKHGFEIEGLRHKSALLNGTYKNAYYMGRLNPKL